MKILKLLIVLGLFISATAPDGGGDSKIKWMDFNTGFAQAKKEGKIAIIDCYTDWCGWCKEMDKKTFTNDTIINRINDNYIAIKFNPEKPGKYVVGSGDSLTGRQLLLALSNNKPSGYPTFFYFVPQDMKMFQVPGYKDVNALTEILDNVENYQASITGVKP